MHWISASLLYQQEDFTDIGGPILDGLPRCHIKVTTVKCQLFEFRTAPTHAKVIAFGSNVGNTSRFQSLHVFRKNKFVLPF